MYRGWMNLEDMTMYRGYMNLEEMNMNRGGDGGFATNKIATARISVVYNCQLY